jgi:hypothetical protein
MTASTTALSPAFASLTKIPGKPDALTLRELHREVFTSAGSVKTPLGGGTYGYLGAIMPALEYNALVNAMPFISPVHSGLHPGHPAGATSAMITETNRAYKSAEGASDEYDAVIQALKKEILGAVADTYVSALKRDLLGYTVVPCPSSLQFNPHTRRQPSYRATVAIVTYLFPSLRARLGLFLSIT